IASSARSTSASENVNTSPFTPIARCLRPGMRSAAAIRTVQGSDTAPQYITKGDREPSRCGARRTRRALESGLALENLGVLKRPPADFDLPDDVLFRDEAPVPAVRAVVAVVAHDEVVALPNHVRAPIVMAAELVGNVVVSQRLIVDVDATVYNPDR